MYQSMKWTNQLFIFLLLSAFLWSCQTDQVEPVPDVSKIEIDLSLRRFEQDLFTLDTTQMEASLESLKSKYPELSNIFFGQILGTNDPQIRNTIGEANYVKGFINFPGIRELYDTCQYVFADFSEQEASFRKAFQYLKFYFPDMPTPDLTTFISEYTVGAFIYKENSLAVGLDFFLGSDYPYAAYNPNNPTFSQYLTRTFNKDHLVSKTIRVLVEDMTGPPNGSKMLDIMIHRGKQLYLLDQLLPHVADTAVLEFSKAQLNWLQNNERDIWAFFLTEDLLYSTDMQKYRKYVDYSPNAPGMPIEAPGRAASWMGYQIVRAYMRKVTSADLADLINARDAQEILDKSRYRPPRQ
jgi:hypothetical protein